MLCCESLQYTTTSITALFCAGLIFRLQPTLCWLHFVMLQKLLESAVFDYYRGEEKCELFYEKTEKKQRKFIEKSFRLLLAQEVSTSCFVEKFSLSVENRGYGEVSTGNSGVSLMFIHIFNTVFNNDVFYIDTVRELQEV